MKREELKEELKDVKTLYVVGIKKGTSPHWDRGIWRKFRVYYIKDGELKQLWIDIDEENTPAYWVPRHKTKSGNWVGGYFECNALGTDRVFEIVHSIGVWLYGDGYKFKAEFLSHE